jgi:hypothetical protein
MADVTAEYRRVQSAYAQPTLTLISRASSAAIIAVFRSMFSTDKPTVPTARMHDQVDALLNDLRRAGFPDVPAANGRDASIKWMKDGWLNRTTDDDGTEVYSLTSHALDGLRTVERLTKDRSVSLSSHLIAGLIRHLRDFSASVSPDVGAYIAAQQAEKARIQAEIDRVLDGGEVGEATDDDIIQGFTELQRYLGELPSDFSRVVESYREFETGTISDFRTDAVSSGEAVRRYLNHVQNLATASAAGRGFEGALQLLRDPELLDQVNTYIETLLDDERASELLTPEERGQVRNTVTLIRDGLKRVLEQRSRVSRTLHDYITSHDVERDHELAATLRALEGEVHTWMQTAGPRAKAPLVLLPGKAEMQHLRTKLHDPANDEPPPPLTQTEAPANVGGLTLAELRARGGPSHATLRDELHQHFDTAGGVDSLAALFHSLPTDLRRPVEVLGLLPLARRNGLEPTGHTEIYETVRPDGSRRLLNVPHYASTDPKTATHAGAGASHSEPTSNSTSSPAPDGGLASQEPS